MVQNLIDLLVSKVVDFPVLHGQRCWAPVTEMVGPLGADPRPLVRIIAPFILLDPLIEGDLLLLVRSPLLAISLIPLIPFILYGDSLVLVQLVERSAKPL